MLYGSQARGTPHAHSDIDILVLVKETPCSASDGDLTITAYLPSHLRALAERGSLFVLHLIHDGVVLHDPESELTDILTAYRPPSDPYRLSTECAVAAGGLLSATLNERTTFGAGMQSLAFYILRTAAYDACARQGRPEFDCAVALEKLQLARLVPLLNERREAYSEERLDQLLAALPVVLPGCDKLREAGLAATAVAIADTWPLACDLLSGVLAGQAVDYTALFLPLT